MSQPGPYLRFGGAPASDLPGAQPAPVPESGVAALGLGSLCSAGCSAAPLELGRAALCVLPHPKVQCQQMAVRDVEGRGESSGHQESLVFQVEQAEKGGLWGPEPAVPAWCLRCPLWQGPGTSTPMASGGVAAVAGSETASHPRPSRPSLGEA